MTYKLTTSTSVIRTTDGATIPKDNAEYQLYVDWLAEGSGAGACGHTPTVNIPAASRRGIPTNG